MLVEERLRKDPQLFMVTALFRDAWEHDRRDPPRTGDECLRAFNGLLMTVEDPALGPWANGAHNGDCTKTCHTCHRCLVEDYTEGAEKFLSWLKDLGYELRRIP